MRLALFIGIFGFLLAPLPLLAHETGASFEQEVGEFLVDIGYSEENPSAGESVVFDFGLSKDGEKASFTDAWVKIENENGVVLATGVHNGTFGGPKLTYAFPQAGSYEISVRYEQGDASLAEASFELPVAHAAAESRFSFDVFSALGGLLLGAGLGLLFRRKGGTA